MKIAYIVPSLINKGPIIVVHNIIHFLSKSVDEIDVYYFDSTPQTLDFNCKTYQINMNTAIDFDKYDIIHCHCFRSDRYLFKWKKKVKKAKIITTLHQDTFKSFRYQYNILLSFVLTAYWCYIQKHFDGVIAISNQLHNYYNKWLSKKISTIYNGCFINIDSSNLDKNLKDKITRMREQKYKILGTYAYVTRSKGLSQIIEIMPLLKEYVFIIIGEGPDIRRLKELSEKRKVLDRVLFFPYMNAPYNCLPLIDVYTMPSYSEGFGLAMIEAALANKAIVCSNIPSFHELFSNEEVCFFELDKPISLVHAIKTSYSKKEEYGKLAYQKATTRFTAEKMADNHLNYYKSIIKNNL